MGHYNVEADWTEIITQVFSSFADEVLDKLEYLQAAVESLGKM